MLNFLFKLRRTEYVDWSVYKEKVDFLNLYQWQQNIRKESIKNLSKQNFVH